MTSWQPMQMGKQAPDWRTPFWGWDVNPDLSIVALVANHTIDLRTAALLWAGSQRRASLIVASGPQRAGKTTLLAAYRDLLPADTQHVYVRGSQEDFSWAKDIDPKRAYVLVNELSDHTPFYCWLPAAAKLFDLVAGGIRFGATLHADTADETLEYLTQSELGLGLREVSGIHLIATIAVGRRGRQPVRCLSALTLLVPHDDENVRTVELVVWHPDADSWEHTSDPEALLHLERRLGMPQGSLAADVTAREATLQDLLKRGVTGAEAVQAAMRAQMP